MRRALRSGQLAKAAGVNVQTLRYYERRGLLPAPQRSLGGHREYDRGAVTVLRVIRGLARLGFTLDEISELIAVGSHRGPRPGLRDAAAAKLVEVDAKIADLQQVHATLAAVLTAGCSDLEECSCDPACPIPFAELTPHVACLADSCPEDKCGAGADPGDGSATSGVARA
jgi:MerR family transcriptional regulator, mercuric resistance operon regulatory protein